MGCAQSNAAAEKALAAREEQVLSPPSKVTDATEWSQTMVQLVRPNIEVHLGSKEPDLKATQMITRIFTNSDDLQKPGKIHYIKAKTTNPDWPWIFVKVYEPPEITSVSPVKFREMKKMKEEYKLVVF